jgi:hypothetical protein
LCFYKYLVLFLRLQQLILDASSDGSSSGSSSSSDRLINHSSNGDRSHEATNIQKNQTEVGGEIESNIMNNNDQTSTETVYNNDVHDDIPVLSIPPDKKTSETFKDSVKIVKVRDSISIEPIRD